jgi:hypothetical protein
VFAKLGTGISYKIRAPALDKRLKGKKKILKLDKAQEEDWEKYRVELDKELIKKLEVVDNIAAIEESCNNKSIDEIWDIISECITRSANITLPSQKVFLSSCALERSSNSNRIQKDLRVLGKLCHKAVSKKEQEIDSEDRQKSNEDINKLNSKYELQIDNIEEEVWSEEKGKELKKW